MNKVAIFGKKGSIAKYDLTENKATWVGNIANGYKPNIIGQYEDYLIVFSSVWTGSKMIHCFDQNNGEKLWSHNQEILHSSMIPFIPHTFENHMYYMASSKEIAKLSWKTGKIVYVCGFFSPCLNSLELPRQAPHREPRGLRSPQRHLEAVRKVDGLKSP